MHVMPLGHRGEVTFVGPVKSVFGGVLCDTDGSIGYPTEFGPETAIDIVNQCRSLVGLLPGDERDLDRVMQWASAGYRLFADWQH